MSFECLDGRKRWYEVFASVGESLPGVETTRFDVAMTDAFPWLNYLRPSGEFCEA